MKCYINRGSALIIKNWNVPDDACLELLSDTWKAPALPLATKQLEPGEYIDFGDFHEATRLRIAHHHP